MSNLLGTIGLRFGPGGPAPPLEFCPTTVTVLVGPNNSGKSTLLREFRQRLLPRTPAKPELVLANFDVPVTRDTEAIRDLFLPVAADLGDELEYFPIADDGMKRQRNKIQPNLIEQATRNLNVLVQIIGQAYCLSLFGRDRLQLARQQPLADLQRRPHNHLDVLFRDTERRQRVRDICYRAFGLYFALDPTHSGRLRIRLATRPPSDAVEEQALDQRAVAYHSQAMLLSEFSEGVQAFVGLIAAVESSPSRIILLDEAEAFLHPPLARHLGYHLASLAAERSAHLFAATHSSHFLIGCIESGVDVQILRLTHTDLESTARLLPNDRLRELMRRPLLRSAGVLAGLFHDGVIVGESDTDRAFYQEIAHRLMSSGDTRFGGVLFANAHNKQSVPEVFGPLRELGIPAAGIVDIDVLKEGGRVFSKLLTAAGVPQTQRHSLKALRADVCKALDATGQDPKRDGGLDLLDDPDRIACQRFLNELATYGVFVVPWGELESWLQHLGATGHGPGWLVDIFGRMGDDPNDPAYVNPTEGDVWEFLALVMNWIRDPSRLGIPL